jgi:hypothetical protein
VNRFSAEAMVDGTLAVYREVMSEKRARDAMA